MKKILFLPFLIFTLCQVNIVAQKKIDFEFSFQSNVIDHNIENTLSIIHYPSEPVNGSVPNPGEPIPTFDLIRETHPKIGLETGIKERAKILKNLFLISGIEGVLYKFARIEWLENKTLENEIFSPPYLPVVTKDFPIIELNL